MSTRWKSHKRMQRALIIENDTFTRALLSAILSGERYEIIPASTNAEAIEALSNPNHGITLVVAEVNTMIRDDWPMLNQVLAGNPLVHVVILTEAQAQEKMAETCGFDTYRKPLNADHFIQRVREFIATKSHPGVDAERYGQADKSRYRDATDFVPYDHWGLNE